MSKRPRPRRTNPTRAVAAGPSIPPPTLVVGIGASAGGLDALEKLFSAVPADTGLAFVVVQHLDPRHPSLLPELLAASSRIPVSLAEDGIRPERDRVYVIAPKAILTIEGGALRVGSSPEETSIGRIDAFLSSLAKDRGESAVGVILSGAGSDGIVGLRILKDHGGLVLAQDPQTAAHGSMPRTAIEAGLVDQVLALDQIPSALVAHARHLARTGGASGAALEADIAGSLHAICALLRQRTGHDFSRYKEGTLLRRIRRRVYVQRAATASEYLRVLEHDPAEPERLLKDLLIGVTEFFRDPETFATLARDVLPRILEGKPAEAPIRIWVPGCASGEEAYSIAMLVQEQAARDRARFVQIFATDLDAEMIAEARAGRYSGEIADQVSPERLDRFFVREGSGWRVGTELRETCIFSVHSLIRDAPFSALDLVSCRNVLIYLEPDLQKKVIQVFHYALRPGGYLLLGPAEAITNHAELFETVDKKHRIYRRKETVARPPVEFPLSARAVPKFEAPAPGARELFAVIMQERAPEEVEAVEVVSGSVAPPALEEMETELRTTRADLKVAIENAEAANEELRSANEELISTNEELQSANEEMQTSKEELQSLNEELETVNAELQRKVEELATANGDLQNLFASTEIATIFLDRNLRIARFTAAATELLHLIEGDVGRPIADFAPRFDGQDLVCDAREVLRSLKPIERQLRIEPERWFILRVLPYRTVENVIAGVVVTFVDVSELKRAEEELLAARESAEWLASFPARNPIPITEVDSAGQVRYANAAADRLFPGFRSAGADHPWVAHWDEVVRAFREEGATSLERIVEVNGTWFQQSMYYVPETECIRAYGLDITRRKRAEEALRESEERYRLLIEGVKDYAAFMLAPDGTIATWNAGAERLKGYRAEDIVGQHVSCFFPAEDVRAGKPQALLEAAAAQGHAAEEGWRVRKDGSRFWASVLVTAIRDEAGGLRGFAKVTQDITHRKQAEEALRRSTERERFLADVVENATTPFGVGAPDGRLLLFNRAFAALTGYSREELEDPSLSWAKDLTPPEWRDEEAETLAHAVRNRESVRYEKEYRRKDGSRVAIELFAQPVFDEDGKLLHYRSFVTDITERKLAEEAAQRSREGLSRLAEASLRVVRETDLEGMLWAVSQAALALTGSRIATCGHGYVDGQFIIGGEARVPGAPVCPPGRMFFIEKGGVYMELVEGAADSIRLTDTEMRAHPRWWGLPADHVPMRGLLGARLVDRQGKTSGMILVTDKVEGEYTEQDESFLRQLATMASLALQHVQARVSLEESDRNRNEFLAMLSHELRNPLAPIRNSLYILERADPGGEQARRAQGIIDRQVVHLTRLVDDLLDVTRISRGKIQLRRERLDLCDVVRRTVDDHRASFAHAGLEVQLAAPDAPVWMDADRTRIAQAIGNLLNNSAKFTETGGTVAVSVEENVALGQGVVRVRDTGVGIAPEMLHRVFEAFAQADATLDRGKGGLGLGLALVKGLVEMHGGTVSVESEGLGKGAEFTLRLPLGTEDPPSAALVRSALGGGLRRVLVIEDNVDAAESLREVLEIGKHTVEVAFSGPEGIERARAFRPDVVLCDIGLPGMDGYQVARAIRSDPVLRDTKLVALTGYAAPEDVARARESGFDAHVAKPLGVDALEEALTARAEAQPGRGPRTSR